MYRRNGNTVSFQDYIERLDKASKEREEWFMQWFEKFDQDRKETNERLEKDRKASEERLAADRRASEERLAADRKASEDRLAADRKESEARFATYHRWLVATFVAVVAVLAVLMSTMIPNLGL